MFFNSGLGWGELASVVAGEFVESRSCLTRFGRKPDV